jgi:hypothetical protein
MASLLLLKTCYSSVLDALEPGAREAQSEDRMDGTV